MQMFGTNIEKPLKIRPPRWYGTAKEERVCVSTSTTSNQKTLVDPLSGNYKNALCLLVGKTEKNKNTRRN